MDLVWVCPVHHILVPVLMHLAGFYEPVRQRLNELIDRPASDQVMLASVIAGAASGALGGEHDHFFVVLGPRPTVHHQLPWAILSF